MTDSRTRKNKYFVFVDESGNNHQENLFLLGCLFVPVEKIGEYYDLLQKVKAKIIGQVKRKEAELEQKLFGNDLANFYKGRRSPYEIKFKHINDTVAEGYTWLISQYFKFPDVRYCCLIIDKNKYPAPAHLRFFDVYVNQLALLLKCNIKDNEEIVLLPDDITISGKISYENAITKKLNEDGKNIFGVHRQESHANIFVQMTDLLTGSILYDLVKGTRTSKLKIVNKVKQKINKQNLGQKFTVNRQPNYFSVWVYKK